MKKKLKKKLINKTQRQKKKKEKPQPDCLSASSAVRSYGLFYTLLCDNNKCNRKYYRAAN